MYAHLWLFATSKENKTSVFENVRAAADGGGGYMVAPDFVTLT